MGLVYPRGLKAILASGAASVAFCGVSVAQSAENAEQDLATALNAFATDANLEIMFSPELVENQLVHNAEAVSREAEPEVVLEALLDGTGLVSHEAAPNVYVVSTEGDLKDVLEARLRFVASQLQQADTVSVASEPAGPRSEGTPPGVLQGKVVDEATGAALAGAILTLQGTGLTASTNTAGDYRFAAAPAGEYTLVVSYLGASSEVQTVTVDPNSRTVQNFSLVTTRDEIVVRGNRSSLLQALNQQRAASNNSTVVASDLLGSFPAETVSEALRRVPGVAFTRDAETGEGTNVSVRGFNSDAINIQLNGLDLQGTGIGRTVDLSGFLADNISQVTIQKSLLPSHEGDGSGGLIEIETKSGLDYGDQYFSVGIEREQGLEGDFGSELQANATAAWQLADNLGVVGTIQYRDTGRTNHTMNYISGAITSQIEVLPAGFTSLFRVPESFNFPFDPEFSGRLITGGNFITRDREETNLTASVNLAWEPAEHTSLRLDLQRIDRDEELSTSRSSMFFSTLTTDMPVPELGGEVRRRRYLTSLRPTLGYNFSKEDLTTTTASFRGDTNVGRWEFKYKAGYSKAVSDRINKALTFATDSQSNLVDLIDPNTIVTTPDDNAAMTERVVGGAVVFVGDGIPRLSLTDTGRAFVNDPSNYYLLIGSDANSRNPTETYIGEFQSRYNFANGFINYLEAGVKYDTVKRSNSDDILSNTNILSSQSYVRIFGRNTFLSELADNSLNLVDLSSIGAGDTPLPFIQNASVDAILDQAANLVVDDPDTPENEERFRLTDRTGDPIENSNAISPSTITEKALAAYLEGKFTVGNFELVGGVRYESVDRNGRNLSTPSVRTDIQEEPRATFIDVGLVSFDDTGGVTKTWTPSALATYRHRENLVFRLGYFQSTVNPDIRLVSQTTTVRLDLRSGRDTATIREANPDLVPSVSNNFDLDIAYYFKDNPGLIRAGFFYKTISNNFTSVFFGDVGDDGLRQRVLDELAPLAAVRPDLVALTPDTQFFLNRPQNGEGGDIYGAEAEIIRQLDFLPESWPGFLSNFSVLGNVTYTISDFSTLESARNDAGELITLSLDRPLAGQSKWSGTGSVAYEEGGFSGRLIYTFQSAAATDYDEFNLNAITPKFSTLDLRMSYTFDRGQRYSFYLEGDDLLFGAKKADIRNGFGSQFGEGSPDFFFPQTLQFNGGRTLTVGGRIAF